VEDDADANDAAAAAAAADDGVSALASTVPDCGQTKQHQYDEYQHWHQQQSSSVIAEEPRQESPDASSDLRQRYSYSIQYDEYYTSRLQQRNSVAL
jgi:hypothetical protein